MEQTNRNSTTSHHLKYRVNNHLSFFVSMVVFISLIPIQYGNCAENAGAVTVAETDIEYLDYLLDMKVTSGSFLDLNLENSPVSMTIITRENIELSGARHMSELLEIFVPGFQYMFNKWNGTQWGMRGVTNDRNTKTIYLVNGHKMNTQARDGFQGETVLGLLGDIERVEVLRGPAGLVYGSGAIAGVVNVITANDTSAGSTLHTSVGTYGAQEIEIDLHTSPAAHHTVSFSAGFRRADGLDAHQSRIYGFGAWPFPSLEKGDPQDQPIKNGVPSDGNFGSTDGNWRLAGEWAFKNLDCYFRLTRQSESAGGLFLLDPWPDITGPPDEDAQSRRVDGTLVTPEDPFWISTDSYGNGRKQYISDNLLVMSNLTVPLGMNELRLNAAFDGNTTRMVWEKREGYENDPAAANINNTDNTFGEKRVTASGIFHLISVPHLQLASGMEYRFDIIGKDLDGKNESMGNTRHLIVSNINYMTYSLFSEGLYEINNSVDLHFGGRLDFHTRAIMANPKAALIYHPREQHAFKLICQSSSNNGSADNYEYNRFHFDDDGNVGDKPMFVEAIRRSSQTDDILQPAPPISTLHDLKPEKVYSAELAYTGIYFGNMTLAPSASIGHVKDLFGWSQTLFRVINAGAYSYFNCDVDAKVDKKLFVAGVNHTFQRPIGTDVDKESRQYKVYTLKQDGAYYDSQIVDGVTRYHPIVADSMANFNVNLVKDGITGDGRNFLNLNTHITKFYCTFRPFDWMSLHTNVRLFWGLRGREALYAKDEGFDYLHIADGPGKLGLYNYLKQGVSKKVNAGVHFSLPNGFDVALFAYDILGVDRPNDPDAHSLAINTIRWQQMAETSLKELYSTDQRSFSIKISKQL